VDRVIAVENTEISCTVIDVDVDVDVP